MSLSAVHSHLLRPSIYRMCSLALFPLNVGNSLPKPTIVVDALPVAPSTCEKARLRRYVLHAPAHIAPVAREHLALPFVSMQVTRFVCLDYEFCTGPALGLGSHPNAGPRRVF